MRIGLLLTAAAVTFVTIAGTGCATRNRTDANPVLSLSIIHWGDTIQDASSAGGNLENQTQADGNTATTDAALGLNRGVGLEDAAETIPERLEIQLPEPIVPPPQFTHPERRRF